MGIVTRGLGGTHIITMGYGFTAVEEIIRAIHQKRITWFCPYCGLSLRNPTAIFTTRDFGRKTTKCAICFNEVVWTGTRWGKPEDEEDDY